MFRLTQEKSAAIKYDPTENDMNVSISELEKFSFQGIANLKITDGYVHADIAVWVSIKNPSDITKCRLFVRCLEGVNTHTTEINELVTSIGSETLLAVRAKVPAHFAHTQFIVCIEVEGSSYRVKTLKITPIVDTPTGNIKNSASYTAQFLSYVSGIKRTALISLSML